MWYIKMQILNYENARSLHQKTSALSRYCEVFQLIPVRSDLFRDTFYVELPEDQFQACQLINAFEAYCYVKTIACRIESERETVSLYDLIKLIDRRNIDSEFTPG